MVWKFDIRKTIVAMTHIGFVVYILPSLYLRCIIPSGFYCLRGHYACKGHISLRREIPSVHGFRYVAEP